MSKQIVNKDGIVIPAGTMEDFKRPSHNDFATEQELRERKFSGQRVSSLSGSWELWVLGDKVKEVNDQQIGINGNAINEAIEEYFGLHDALPDMADLKRFRGVKE